jgi:hypothetical protein
MFDNVMSGIVRFAVLLLAAFGLAGCVWAFEPIRYTITGPGTSVQLADTGRAIEPGERLALVVSKPREDAARLAACVASGLASRLPGGQPAPIIPDAEAAARILSIIEPLARGPGLVQAGGALPPAAAGLGFDWIVMAEDQSSQDANTGVDRTLVPGRPEPWRQEVRAGRTVVYRLALMATIFDLRGQRLRGTVDTYFDTQGGAYLIMSGTGMYAGVAPMIEVPAGTGAMTICAAFGRAIGDVLQRATSPEARPPS